MNFIKTVATSVVAVLALGSAAQAAPILFSGYDAGSGSLATSPNSTSARAAFEASIAGGSTTIYDFDTNNSGATFSDLNNTSDSGCGPVLCGYNTTVGGSNFHLQVGGSQTITFDSAVSYFGGYFSGWQIGTQTITYTDGDTVTLNMPDVFAQSDGGTVFFGFHDAGASIASIFYNAGNDIVAVDDLAFGSSSVPSVPLPAGGLLLLTGLGGLAVTRRRKAKS